MAGIRIKVANTVVEGIVSTIPVVNRRRPQIDVIIINHTRLRAAGWVRPLAVADDVIVVAGWDAEERRLVEGSVPRFPARVVGRVERDPGGVWKLQPGAEPMKSTPDST